MRESTRFYARSFSNFLLAGVSIAQYLRLGETLWLVIGLITGPLGIYWLVGARTAGDALAPPLVNPARIKKLAITCGVAGVALLATMLWRVQGDWIRLGEQENLWLAMGWIALLSIAVIVPIEFRRSRPLT